jgi:hypothetical protein
MIYFGIHGKITFSLLQKVYANIKGLIHFNDPAHYFCLSMPDGFSSADLRLIVNRVSIGTEFMLQ